MKKVCILVPRGQAIISSVVGPYKVLHAANRFVMAINPASGPVFEPQLLGIDAETNFYGGAFQVKPDVLLSDKPQPDLVIIPASQGPMDQELKLNAPFIPWIAEQYARGTEVASLCVGAFILASTGLLNGKSCTTHWSQADLFREMFPEVNLMSEKVITDESGLYSSGGAYSFLNLMLYLVEKYVGREVAIQCAKYFEVDIDRNNQSQFSIFQGQRAHEDRPILEVQNFIESHVAEKITLDELASLAVLSRRNFIRRFKKATSNTPLEYIQRVKVEAAKKSLESTFNSVNEAMYQVGYNDAKAFRNLFRKFTGLSPNEYRRKYNRIHALN